MAQNLIYRTSTTPPPPSSVSGGPVAKNSPLTYAEMDYNWNILATTKVDTVVGFGLSSNDYTSAEKTKLAGIAVGATNYVHPTGDGNLHVPATGTTSGGEVLTAGSTPGSISWQPLPALPSGDGNLYVSATGTTSAGKVLTAGSTAGSFSWQPPAIPTPASIGCDTKANTDTHAPPGAVQFFAMNTAPTGWLAANGAAVSRTTYANLFAAIGTLYGAGDGSTTFNLPDLRGTFLRGIDNGKGIDTSRTFGSSQGYATQYQSGSATLGWYGDSGVVLGASGVFGTIGYGAPGSVFVGNRPQGAGGGPSNQLLNINIGTAAETRPMNTALLICIKF